MHLLGLLLLLGQWRWSPWLLEWLLHRWRLILVLLGLHLGVLLQWSAMLYEVAHRPPWWGLRKMVWIILYKSLKVVISPDLRRLHGLRCSERGRGSTLRRSAMLLGLSLSFQSR